MPDDYTAVVAALSEGLLVKFNTSDPSSMTTEEFLVDEAWDGSAVRLKADSETYYKLKEKDADADPGGFALYGERDGWFVDHYADVTSIEVVGIAG